MRESKVKSGKSDAGEGRENVECGMEWESSNIELRKFDNMG